MPFMLRKPTLRVNREQSHKHMALSSFYKAAQSY